jgi:translation initiation factor 2D
VKNDSCPPSCLRRNPTLVVPYPCSHAIGDSLLIWIKIKTLAPLRSSDRRKISDQIISEYQIDIPKQILEEDDPAKRADAAAGLGAIRSSLLPDGAQWAKFSTTVGAELKTVSGTVYTGVYDDGEPRILWFKVDERLYPTG